MNEEKKRILKMVETGRLTVEEALKLLEELDKSQKAMEKKQEEMMGELSTVVHFEEAKKEHSSSGAKVQSAKEKILDFVDTAIKKIKDFDLDFNFGHSVEISHIFHQSDVYLKDIDIDISNGSVQVIPWDQNDVRVECEAKVYRVETVEEARNIFLKDVLFSIGGERLRFSTQQKWMKINAKIYIPKTDYDHVKIRMFNGPIASENLTVDNYKVKTANGKIDMIAIKSKSVEAETANGKITVENSVIEDFEAETINGSINIEGDFRKVDVHSFNGDIRCSTMSTRCEFIEAKATTGSIKLILPEQSAVSGELRSNLGGFDIDFDGIQVIEEKSEVVQKYMSFKPQIHNHLITRVLADTKTGSIKLKKRK
ncbi:DUF4097 domain-containing protein [Bacillus sp. 31A1R]|uniref:DUF4097 domain-containing protein n=1 Tax=Robertmurraya mangrovi TaxID=3098077 RepID=A0ABU5J458_9BACI|nr:DUF4097 domain-containing protein [Bacillus sp. 31A1R]MDZ5474121.1 DUF4097 domain-containing protein [Bacillus sp. 31A1R]